MPANVTLVPLTHPVSAPAVVPPLTCPPAGGAGVPAVSEIGPVVSPAAVPSLTCPPAGGAGVPAVSEIGSLVSPAAVLPLTCPPAGYFELGCSDVQECAVLQPIEEDGLNIMDLSENSLTLLETMEVTVTSHELSLLNPPCSSTEDANASHTEAAAEPQTSTCSTCSSTEDANVSHTEAAAERQKKVSYGEKHPLLPVPAACEEGRCRLKCGKKMTEYERREINEKVGALEWSVRAQWYRTHVYEAKVERRREGREGDRRQASFQYHLPIAGKLTRVCKGFFLTTVGLHPMNDTPVRTALASSCVAPQDGRGKKEATKRADVALLTQHIESFQPCTPHYRYQHAPHRRYLPSDITATTMHKDYIEKHPESKVSYETYRKQLKEMKISFTVLGNEECEVCTRHGHHNVQEHGTANGNVTDHTEGCDECFAHQEHVTRARDARKAYRTDADRPLSEDELVVSADLMKVSLIPIMPHKSAIFTPRLVVFNETFAPLLKVKRPSGAAMPTAVLWHEATAGRDASDIAAAYWRFLLQHRDKKHIIIYADNCSAQNKSWVFVTMLVTYVQQAENVTRDITMKYLEPGHTAMSADVSHQVIQKKLSRSKHIDDFEDFVSLVDESGVKTKVMSPEEFFNFEDGVSKSRLGLLAREGLRPRLRDVRQLQVRRGSERIFLRESHEDEAWKGYTLLRSNFHPAEKPTPRRVARGLNKDKIEAICRTLTPLMPSHKALFWRRLHSEASRAGVRDLTKA